MRTTVTETYGESAEQGDSPSGVNGWLNRTVLGVGLTSALGDLAYETGTVVLPGFLATIGGSAAALGAIEGIADATASFVKLDSGHLSDRLGRRKPLVLLGYALTPVGQALFALANGGRARRQLFWAGHPRPAARRHTGRGGHAGDTGAGVRLPPRSRHPGRGGRSPPRGRAARALPGADRRRCGRALPLDLLAERHPRRTLGRDFCLAGRRSPAPGQPRLALLADGRLVSDNLPPLPPRGGCLRPGRLRADIAHPGGDDTTHARVRLGPRGADRRVALRAAQRRVRRRLLPGRRACRPVRAPS